MEFIIPLTAQDTVLIDFDFKFYNKNFFAYDFLLCYNDHAKNNNKYTVFNKNRGFTWFFVLNMVKYIKIVICRGVNFERRNKNKEPSI